MPEIDYIWKPGEFQSVFILLISVFFYSTYWFIFKSEKIKAWFYNKYPHDKAAASHVIFTKYAGFILLGFFPAGLSLYFIPHLRLAEYGLRIVPDTTLFSIACIIGLGILAVPVTFKNARQENNLKNYPQIRSKKWSLSLVIQNIMAWSVYLFGYELLFRGILLIPLIESMGMWTAIAVNISFYTLTHIPKGLNETIGAAMLGFILCLLTVMSQTIWIAYFVHLIIALTNSLTALKYHPDMKLIKS